MHSYLVLVKVNSRIQKKIQNFNFCISLPVLVVWLFECVFLSFFCLFCVSYELDWCIVMVLRTHWFCD